MDQEIENQQPLGSDALFGIGRPAWLSPEAHDWPEDFSHENGQYFRECLQCNAKFVAHKRRHICKVCDEHNKAKYDAMTEEERDDADAKLAMAVREVFGMPNSELSR